MENRNMEELMRDLLIEFYEENEENEFYESVYDRYYATVAASFKDEVEEYCKVVIFGDEYRLSLRELYDYNRYLAVETWRDYVDRSLGEEFHYWVSEVVQDDLEDFISRFQQWLSKRDDEWVADVAVALLNGEIDVTEIVTDWLYDRIVRDAVWDYPA